MENVTVRKDELLTILNDNKTAHRGIFEEAVEGYRQTTIDVLEAHLAEVTAGKVKQIMVNLPLPEDHTVDYDRAIRMIEMSVDDTVVLSEADFQSYVMDDWRWKRQFLVSNSAYSATAQASLPAF